MESKRISKFHSRVPLRHILVGALFLQLHGPVTSQQTWPQPPCDTDMAKLCFDDAIQSTQPSGCNWYRIIAPLYTCVDIATAGCYYDEQTTWYNLVYAYNDTLKSDDCNPNCTGQAAREMAMFNCFDSAGFASLAASISTDPTVTSTSAQCTTLIGMNQCLQTATGGCPALTDAAYNIINTTQGGMAAYAQCGINAFQPATTSAPLNILNTYPSPTPTPAPTKDGSVKGTDLWIIILGSILILATILIILIAICYACRRRRDVKRRSIFYDWEPNGRRVYRDEPEFRRERIDFRSADDSGKVFRPVRMTRDVDDRPPPREVYVNQGMTVYH